MKNQYIWASISFLIRLHEKPHEMDVCGVFYQLLLRPLQPLKKDVASFKLRKGMPIGAKVTLRGDKMFEFFDRHTSSVDLRAACL